MALLAMDTLSTPGNGTEVLNGRLMVRSSSSFDRNQRARLVLKRGTSRNAALFCVRAILR